jgi:hypothetical protein
MSETKKWRPKKPERYFRSTTPAEIRNTSTTKTEEEGTNTRKKQSLIIKNELS